MSHVPDPVLRAVGEVLQNTDKGSGPFHFTPTGGGCINNGGRLRSAQGDFFLKWNSAQRYPGMFEAEAKGLALLHNTGAIRIPRVSTTGIADDYQFILMEFIPSAPRVGDYWEMLGGQLAKLHRTSWHQYGLDHDNYIGALPQQNTPGAEWVTFFIEQRLDPQLKRGVDAGSIGRDVVAQFDALYKRLPDILSTETPSLVHGDLWSGNLIVDDAGNPCLIDPAVYFGHREIDLAMTELFGGFDRRFYEAYQAAFPNPPGLSERLDIYKLYPLLVHVNLFGGGYLHDVRSILRSFS
ncbi:MAG TPA: fructosamine kinase family protein [Cyclobacteriaceae bacterium]|nr:fructosamine kinase family protein [Cyclobacteriaceae bacterium]